MAACMGDAFATSDAALPRKGRVNSLCSASWTHNRNRSAVSLPAPATKAGATAVMAGPVTSLTPGGAPVTAGGSGLERRPSALSPDAARSLQRVVETDLQMRSPPSRSPDS